MVMFRIMIHSSTMWNKLDGNLVRAVGRLEQRRTRSEKGR